MMENETKICTKCERELPLSEFNKCKRNKDGLQCMCKCCKKQYYTANREHVLEYKKQWHTEHRAEHIEKMKQWYADNAERLKQYYKQRYSTIEKFAYNTRYNNLIEDRKHGRIGANEDPLPPLEYYIWGIQQRDFYDGKQYHWSEMGFDRIDNSKPHTIENIVPCSTKNNRRRQKMPFEEFVELMKKENEELELIL